MAKRLKRAIPLVVAAIQLAVIGTAPPAHAALRGVSGLLAFQSPRSGNSQLFQTNPDGTRVSVLAQITGQNVNDVAWAPGGAKVAFSSCCPGGAFQIYTMNADGTGLTKLTTSGRNTVPTWSPGGERIAFVSNRTGNYEVFTMNADGTNQVDITNDPGTDQNPSWSDDGTRIAFDSNRSGKSQVYLMKDDGVLITNLTNSTSNDTDPAYSPDGLSIAFSSDRTGKSEIYTMSATDGSGQTDVSNNAASDDRPTWSPDGVKIAFDTDRTGNREIFTMNADGAEQTNVSNNSASDFRPDWQPLPPGDTVVTVSDTGFTPGVTSVPMGGIMEWDFTGTTSHTATDASSIHLFGSGTMPTGGTYGFTLFAAALYKVTDSNSGVTSNVKVLATEDPKTGDVNTTFTITWASKTAPTGLVYDVQIKRPGAGRFVIWKAAQTVVSSTFLPDSGTGVYSFRARLRSIVNGGTTGYCPPSTITVS